MHFQLQLFILLCMFLCNQHFLLNFTLRHYLLFMPVYGSPLPGAEQRNKLILQAQVLTCVINLLHACKNIDFDSFMFKAYRCWARDLLFMQVHGELILVITGNSEHYQEVVQVLLSF